MLLVQGKSLEKVELDMRAKRLHNKVDDSYACFLFVRYTILSKGLNFAACMLCLYGSMGSLMFKPLLVPQQAIFSRQDAEDAVRSEVNSKACSDCICKLYFG